MLAAMPAPSRTAASPPALRAVARIIAIAT